MNTSLDIKIISQVSDISFNKIWHSLADERHFWMQWRLEAFKNQLSYLNIPLDRKMVGMEIGCGSGVLRNQLNRMTHWTVDGIDLDINVLRHNKQGRGQLFIYNVLEKNKDFENKYDFLFLYDVLEHIEDTQPFLDACLFHLKKGGYLFINTPALENFKSVYDKAVGHLRRYNKKTLYDELLKADLRVLDISYWGFFLLPLLSLRKITTSNNQSNDDNIRRGFKPPNRLINSFLKILLKGETFLFKRVPVGASIMAVALK